jgi:hypothetical protein
MQVPFKCLHRVSEALSSDEEVCSRTGGSIGKDGETARRGMDSYASRIFQLMQTFKQMRSGGTSQTPISHPSGPSYNHLASSSSSGPSTYESSSSPSHTSASSPQSLPNDDDESESSDDETLYSGLTEYLERLQLDPTTPRYYGKSPSSWLLKNAMGLKCSNNTLGDVPRMPTINGRSLRRRPEFWTIKPVCATHL